jgi:predicted YcjX-like family ATPase
LITPSYFRLDNRGTQPKKIWNDIKTINEMPCGIGLQNEFVPLPYGICDKKIYSEFENNFKLYKNRVVQPLFKSLSKCHQMIVLIDITHILQGGAGVYNDTQKIIRDLLYLCKPGLDDYRKLLNIISPVRLDKISRIAFVGTKLDIIRKNDEDKFVKLLFDLTGKISKNIDNVNINYFTAAAVSSTTTVSENSEILCGRVKTDNNIKETGVKIPELPDSWPYDWDTKKYNFPVFLPNMPKRKDAPPEQFGLDNIFNFLMKEKFWE